MNWDNFKILVFRPEKERLALLRKLLGNDSRMGGE